MNCASGNVANSPLFTLRGIFVAILKVIERIVTIQFGKLPITTILLNLNAHLHLAHDLILFLEALGLLVSKHDFLSKLPVFILNQKILLVFLHKVMFQLLFVVTDILTLFLTFQNGFAKAFVFILDLFQECSICLDLLLVFFAYG